MPAPAANKHNKLPSKQVHENTLHCALVHIGKKKPRKRKKSVSAFCGTERERSCGVSEHFSRLFVVLLRRAEEMSFLWPFPSRPNTLRHTQTPHSKQSLDKKMGFLCMCVCSVSLFAHCIAVHVWVMDGRKVAQQVNECCELMTVFFLLCASSSFRHL